jgi:type III secretion system YscI/HrpB-like protein
MDISALSAALSRVRTPDKVHASHQNDIQKFLTHLYPKASNVPESTLVSALQTEQAKVLNGMEKAAVSETLSPEKALAVQYGIANSVIGVDIIAKSAGAFSQAINKLVTMQ